MQALRVAVLAVAIALAAPCMASGQSWPDTSEAGGYPGAQTYTSDKVWSGDEEYGFMNRCNAAFLLTDGVDYYTSQPAHCSFKGGGRQMDGCDPLPAVYGGHVEFEPLVYRIGPNTWEGYVYYNSWREMEQSGETDPDACRHNDFALIKVDIASDDWVPSLPGRGGPHGLASSVDFLETVYGAGQQKALGTTAGGWNVTVPNGAGVDLVGGGFVGGTPYLDSEGAAFGYLRWPGEVTSLTRALEYMKDHTDAFDGVTLVDGVDPFVPGGPLP